jgi:glycosyltransferase involved in cell wall biosynthesis
MSADLSLNEPSAKSGRELWDGPWYVKWSARCFAAAIVLSFTLLLRLLNGRSRNGAKPSSNSSPRTILLTAGSASPNWVKNHVRPLALSEACRRVIMVADKKMEPLAKVEWVVPPSGLRTLIGRTPARMLTYFWMARRLGPDICGGFHLLPNALLALVTARWIGAMALYFCVGGKTEFLGGAAFNEKFPFGRTGRMNPYLERRLLTLAGQFDQIITMGTGAKRFLEEREIASAISAVPGGIDDHYFSPNGDARKYDLIVTARLVPIKRLDVFLRVVAAASRSRPDLLAVIVGDGEQRKTLAALAGELGIADRVIFAGHQEDVASYLRKSRLFLLTSDSEGLALSLMEAMMCGLPAVVSDVGDLGDLVENGRNGWRVPRREVDAYAEKAVRLLNDRELLDSFSRQARQDALKLSVPATSRRWERILSQLSAGKKEEK